MIFRSHSPFSVHIALRHALQLKKDRCLLKWILWQWILWFQNKLLRTIFKARICWKGSSFLLLTKAQTSTYSNFKICLTFCILRQCLFMAKVHMFTKPHLFVSYGMIQDYLYIVMPNHGRDLSWLMYHCKGRLDEPVICLIVAQLSCALDFLHTNRVVHRYCIHITSYQLGNVSEYFKMVFACFGFVKCLDINVHGSSPSLIVSHTILKN